MEKNEIKKGSSKVLIILVVILFVIILGMGVYIAYDKKIIFSENEVLDKNTIKTNNSDNGDFKDIDLNSSEFINLYNKLEDYTYTEDRTHGYYDFLDSEKTILGFYNSDIKSSDFTRANNGAATHIISYNVKADVLSDSLKNIFGDDININYELATGNSFVLKREVYDTIGMVHKCEGGLVSSYDSSSNTYFINMNMDADCSGGTVGSSAKLILRKIVSAQKSNDMIIVKEKAIYLGYEIYNDNITYKVYSDKDKKNLIDTLNYNENTVSNETINVDNYNKTSTITHTYKLNKTTNQYYFASSEIN